MPKINQYLIVCWQIIIKCAGQENNIDSKLGDTISSILKSSEVNCTVHVWQLVDRSIDMLRESQGNRWLEEVNMALPNYHLLLLSNDLLYYCSPKLTHVTAVLSKRKIGKRGLWHGLLMLLVQGFWWNIVISPSWWSSIVFLTVSV